MLHEGYDVKTFLLNNSLFKNLSKTDLNSLVNSVIIKQFAKNEILFNEGDSVKECIVVFKGILKIFTTNSLGQEKTIYLLRNNDIIFTDLMLNQYYSYSAIALTKTTCFIIPKNIFHKVFNTNCKCMQELLTYKLDLDQKALNSIKLYSEGSSKDKFINFLMQHYIKSNMCELNKATEYITITLDIDKKTIASYLGITPETLSRILLDLTTEGFTVNKNKVSFNRNLLMNYCKDPSRYNSKIFACTYCPFH